MSMVGSDVVTKNFNIKHISTRATVGKSTPVFVCHLGTSITWGQGATFPGDTQTQNHPLFLKQLFEMDKIDNGSVAGQYDCVSVGIQKRTLNFNYLGTARTVQACHEGRQGWKLTDYLGIGTVPVTDNPFWDATNNRFSVKVWYDKYKTLAQDGKTRLVAGSTAGSLVTDVNAYDVCIPTHFVIELAPNDANNSTPAQWLANTQTLIQLIKNEYAANGWGSVFIAINFFDSAGTYFPSKYPRFSENIATWNNLTTSLHDKLYKFIAAWQAAYPTDTEDADKTYFLPGFWTMPTAEAASIRALKTTQSDANYFGSGLFVDQYGAGPLTHLNPDAHMSFAYQNYSWIKYTLSL